MNGGTEMDVRENLVELLLQEDNVCEPSDCNYCGVKGSCGYYRTADRLIANGVTVQEWISVKDRLPEHGDVVLVWHTYMEHPFVCQWDERSDCWIDDKWTFGRNTITHWCYLPQPPKGE